VCWNQSENTVATVSNSRLEWQTAPVVPLGDLPIESLPFPAAMVDRQGAIVAENPEWSSRYPTSQPGGLFQDWCAEIHAGAPDLAAALVDAVRQAIADRHRFVQEYGERGRYLVTISPCLAGALVLHQDLRPGETDGQQAQSQRMEIVGRLVGGVAHDFANLITLVEGYGDILLNRIGEKDPLRPELEEIRKAARHGARLTAQLLGFTRGQNTEPVEMDLNALIGDMERMLRPIIGEHVKLRTELAAGLRKVVVDRGQMEQVLVNLILNARDAMPGGGSIRIGTSNCEIGEEAARRHGVAVGPAITLSVADSGCGIGPEDAARVFEPFFTTKQQGKGTGLGLSTVRDIVRGSGGDVWVRSEPGLGAVFTICLPAVRQTAADGTRTAVANPAQPGHETVLLVEDEESVRRLLVHLLKKRGYEVVEASSGEEGLRIFKQRGTEIHLVLTDVVMPGMSGPSMAEKLREVRPDTPIVFMSGYTDDVLARTGVLAAGMSFLQKPLRPDVLAAKLREALDSPSRPFNPR
jgi:two-component system, cell cycle sensor histidine kinase and response regulator CckA